MRDYRVKTKAKTDRAAKTFESVLSRLHCFWFESSSKCHLGLYQHSWMQYISTARTLHLSQSIGPEKLQRFLRRSDWWNQQAIGLRLRNNRREDIRFHWSFEQRKLGWCDEENLGRRCRHGTGRHVCVARTSNAYRFHGTIPRSNWHFDFDESQRTEIPSSAIYSSVRF